MFLMLQYGTRSVTGKCCIAISVLVVCMTCAMLPGSRAAAEESDDASVTAAARALAVEGVKLAQADRCKEAVDKLQRAEQLHHSPIVLAQLGECLIQQGRLVEGLECLRGVSREPLPDKPSEAMSEAYAKSRSLLEATRGKVASLTISVDAAPEAEPSVTIDGGAVPAALLGAGRPTDPGEHVIQASAPGYLTTTQKLMLGPGQGQTVLLALVVDPAAPRARNSAQKARPAPSVGNLAAPSPLPPTAAGTVQPSPAATNLLPAYIAWAAGAVALGVGVGFGVAAISDKNQLAERCPNRVCPAAQSPLIDAANTNARISTVATLTAIGAAAIGSVLFFALDARAEAERPPTTEARVGLGAGDVSVRF